MKRTDERFVDWKDTTIVFLVEPRPLDDVRLFELKALEQHKVRKGTDEG